MAKVNLKKKLQFWGTGRRKKAIARVRLIPAGSGTIVINDRAFEDYFPQGTLQYIVKQPLVLLEAENKYDVSSTSSAADIPVRRVLSVWAWLVRFSKRSPTAVPHLKRKASSRETPAQRKERSTASKRLVVRLSSPRDNSPSFDGKKPDRISVGLFDNFFSEFGISPTLCFHSFIAESLS